MPTPSIVSITPSSGPTAGRLLVELVGAGFRQPPDPDGLRSAVLRPSVRVLVGDRAANDVRVLGNDRLTCIIPAGGPGPVDIVVQNLDHSGRPIPGELATAHEALTFVRQALAVEADTLAVRRLEAWYREGADLSSKLPVLSTYLGHQSMAGTQRYLQLTASLHPDLTSILEQQYGAFIPRGERA